MQKYSGAGNKFIVVDNLDGKYSDSDYGKTVAELISRTENSETDGVIFIEKSGKADFKMNYFNKDGTGDALCGNGLRCTFKYIFDNGISEKTNLKIEAVSEIYDCKSEKDGLIAVVFPPPVKVKTNFKLKVHFQEWWELLNCSYVDCGSPHIVVFTDEIEKPKVNSLEEVNISEWGRNIRMHKDLMPEGANVNFVKVTGNEKGELEIRSYERGVEGETLACGTGAISSALIFYILRNPVKPVRLLTRSGEFLFVDFIIEKNKLLNVVLSGNAERIK
ncbi:MAG: diaminopimelate epimerase [Ignavibacteria bacterium]|nr:diaminopimelate epimerase [Ignavibacteria bacterium]